DLWNNIKKKSLTEQTEEFEYKIIGSDSSRKAIGIAKQNKRFASLHKDIEICYNSIENQIPPKGKGILITNPPYGERLKSDDLIKLYKTIGDVLKKKYNGYTAWIISSDPEALKFVGLKPSKKIILFNGPLECRFAKYEIYEGSRRRK
ncbi:MAG: RNA methyltransferase, partial [Bacteroidales bacterium]|nr:RNA methyltransferase [Bacteroidales bacterium]